MGVFTIDIADIITDHPHCLFYRGWLTLIQLLNPFLVTHQGSWFIGYTGSPKGGDEAFKLFLEGLEEAFNDLGFGIVALCEVGFDPELGEDTSQFQFQIMVMRWAFPVLGLRISKASVCPSATQT